MELDDVRAFVAVVDAGSVSRAATELFLTQPAVTRRLQRLENAVGARLLDRRRRPVALTEAGRAALIHCRQLLASMQELRAVAADDDEPSGELRIGVAHALTELTLFEPVEHLRRTFPHVAVRLRTGWSRELLERVRTGALDEAVLLLPEGEHVALGLAAEQLGRERLFIVASRRTAARDLRGIRDIGAMGWVLNPEGCNGRVILQRALHGAGAALRVEVETYSYELQLALVARNRGLGLIPGLILAQSRLQRELQTLRIPGLEFPFTIWAVRGNAASRLQPVLDDLDKKLRKRIASLTEKQGDSEAPPPPKRRSRVLAREEVGAQKARMLRKRPREPGLLPSDDRAGSKRLVLPNGDEV